MNRIRSNLQYFYQLLRRLGIMMFVFTIIKLIFFFYNQALFPIESNSQLTTLLLNALRFDAAAIVYVNTIFIILSLFPTTYRQSSLYKKIQLGSFLLFNSIAIIFELIDIGFFKFAFRRSIGSDLNLFQNTSKMIPAFLKEYWWLIICFSFILFTLYYFYKKTTTHVETHRQLKRFQISIFFLGIIVLAIVARGGVQLRPIMSLTAFQYVSDSRLAPLITNTSLSLIFSSQQNFLKKKTYFKKDKLGEVFNTKRQYHKDIAMDRKNVFIITLESFGMEHVSYYNPALKTTPFLDSLIDQSYFLDQSYANGLRSTKGVIAITSGIPTLMNSPLMFSAYQSNRVDGLAKILKREGYTTGFFHGANPGSMEFERFSKVTGFEHYHDRIEFNNDQEYDGQWGIWDEPFFQYTAQQVNQYEQPFFAFLFSLTSHHPYKTPDWFEKEYPTMTPLARSVRYADYALEQFFKTAKKMPWYENTVFVITADHIGQTHNIEYLTVNGRYKIPIIFFDPSQNIKGKHKGIAQQVDIMPTILDLLKYDKPFASYGKSMMDTLRNNLSYNFDGRYHHIMNEDYLLTYNERWSLSYFNYKNDPLLKNNLIKIDSLKPKWLQLEDQLKAVIQTHHWEMIENKLYLE